MKFPTTTRANSPWGKLGSYRGEMSACGIFCLFSNNINNIYPADIKIFFMYSFGKYMFIFSVIISLKSMHNGHLMVKYNSILFSWYTGLLCAKSSYHITSQQTRICVTMNLVHFRRRSTLRTNKLKVCSTLYNLSNKLSNFNKLYNSFPYTFLYDGIALQTCWLFILQNFARPSHCLTRMAAARFQTRSLELS